MNDEQAIRNLVETWFSASKAGDTETVLGLMAEDAVFMVPGQEPFGKEAFATMSSKMKGTLIEGTGDIKEIKILGDFAYIRNYLTVKTSPPGSQPVTRSGYTLTILQKGGDGKWKLSRDANLLQ